VVRGRRARTATIDAPVVEWYGPGALVSDPGNTPYECWRLLDALTASAGGDLVVLVSPRAYRHPAIAETVLAVCRRALEDTETRLRVAFPPAGDPNGPYAGALADLARSSGTTIVASDGPVLVLPGGVLFAGPATGAWGWRAFAPDGTTTAVGYRYPAPAWEEALPRDATPVGSLLAEPAPAGLVLRDARSARLTADDPLLLVPPDNEQPGLVVDFDGVPEMAVTEVAELFSAVDRRLSRRLTVAPGRQPDAEWLAGLGEQFVPSRADAVKTPRPWALKAAWHRPGPRFFQAEDGPVVEVMPGALLLRPAGLFGSGGLASFDPLSGDLSVGTPGEPVPSGLVDALEETWLDGPARIRLTGDADGPARARLLALASAHGVSCEIDEGVDR
jgi:hypothetical protein